MTMPLLLLLVVMWLVTLTLICLVLYGPRRWYLRVTSQVRPDAVEPTEDGYWFQSLRTGVLALVALVLSATATFEAVHVSNDELYETTGRAVDLVGELDTSAARIEAQIEVLLHRDVTLVDVTDVVDGSDPSDDSSGEPATRSYDVALGDRSSGLDEGEDPADLGGPVVCVAITTYRSSAGVDDHSVSTSSFPCEG